MINLDPSFRHLVEVMLNNKPEELKKLVELKVTKVVDYTNANSISRESLAIIIMQAECELERENNRNSNVNCEVI